MTFSKLILTLFAVAVLAIVVLAIIVGFSVFQYKVLNPRQHTKNVEKALISNLKTWETGVATIYTVITKIETDTTSYSSSFDMVCIPKTRTSNDFKSGLIIATDVMNFGSQNLIIPLIGSYHAVFKVPFSCSGLARYLQEHEFPYTAIGYQPVEIQHSAEPVTSCTSFVGRGPVQLQTMRVLTPQVVSMRLERVSDAISVDVYNPKDSGIYTEYRYRYALEDTLQVPSDNRFSWREQKMCWTNSSPSEGYTCSPLANQYCEPDPQ